MAVERETLCAMGQHDPKFRREPAAIRRDTLIQATLSLIAEKGVDATTVRAIAKHADVTQGLIRHYFSTKEDLLAAAYEAHMRKLVGATVEPLQSASDRSPHEQLAIFVISSLHPPALEPGSVALWAGFFSRVRDDARMRAIHQRTYFEFRNRLEALIAEALTAEGRHVNSVERRRLAVACNAVIDGLWLEGGALPDLFEPDELARIGLRSVADITGLELPWKEGRP